MRGIQSHMHNHKQQTSANQDEAGMECYAMSQVCIWPWITIVPMNSYGSGPWIEIAPMNSYGSGAAMRLPKPTNTFLK